MKRFFSILTGLMMLTFCASAQVQVNFNNLDLDANATGAVDVKVNNFTSLTSMQFSINWDSTVYDFVSITNVTALLKDFKLGDNIGVPGIGSIKKGQVTVTWFDSGSGTLPNGTTMFTINLRARNAPCRSTNIRLASTPSAILFTNAALATIQHTTTPGQLNVKGANCGDGGGGGGSTTDVVVTAGTLDAQPNAKVCVPLTVKNFKDITGGSGTITWDPNILMFTGFENNSQLKDFLSNTSSANAGSVSFLYQDPRTPLTLSDGAKLMDVCFTVRGAAGTSTNITLSETITVWDFITEGKKLKTSRVNGKVNVVTNARPAVQLIAANTTGNEGATVCVDFTARNFTEITALQFGIEWDPIQLEYINQGGFNLPSLSNDMFNKASNNRQIRFSWTPANTNPVTITDNARMFNVCFKVLGKCDAQGTANISIIPEIVVGDKDGRAVQFAVTNGSIKTNACGGGGGQGTCTVTKVNNVKCRGGNDGSIEVTVSPTASCNCVWKRNGTTVATNPATNCNLVNATAGTYTLELTCNNVVQCSLTQVITEPAALEASGTVSNIKCFGETNGGITVNVSGGCPDASGNYRYTWSGPSSATGRTPTNLAPGSYSVTIMDSASPSVSLTRSFTVTAPAAALSATEEVTRPTSGNNNGAIKIAIAGGTSPYTTKWTGPTAVPDNNLNPTNLGAGTYNISVTDANGCTATRSVVLSATGGALAIASISLTSGTKCPGQRTGSVSGTLSGGATPYQVSYTGAASGNATVTTSNFTATGLAAGNYTFRVTDGAGATSTSTITVTEPAKINIVGAVKCADGTLANGSISVTVTGGLAPYTYRWSSGQSISKLDNITKGTYNLVLDDANGCQATYIGRIEDCAGGDDPCYTGLSIITPNGDGSNDKFSITCTNDRSGRLAVYDRYGKQVYTQPGYDNSWDGLDTSGNQLPEGPYMWVLVVDFPSGRETFTGTVTIIR